jgi:hypothetical protein
LGLRDFSAFPVQLPNFNNSPATGGLLMSHPFALFIEDHKGPLFRECCDDLEEAKRKAQELADREGFPFFVFSLGKAK